MPKVKLLSQFHTYKHLMTIFQETTLPSGCIKLRNDADTFLFKPNPLDIQSIYGFQNPLSRILEFWKISIIYSRTQNGKAQNQTVIIGKYLKFMNMKLETEAQR